MRRKLWPKPPAKEGALDQMLKNFQVYFKHINFSRNQTKKFTLEPKKWKLKNGPRLLTLLHRMFHILLYYSSYTHLQIDIDYVSPCIFLRMIGSRHVFFFNFW